MENNLYLSEQGFNFQRLLRNVLKKWPYILVAFAVSVIVSIFLYLSTSPSYMIYARLLISDNRDGGASAVSQAAGALPEVMLGQKSNLENQLIVLTSNKQIQKAIEMLDFTVSYYEVDFLRTNEIYKSAPFKVVLDTTQVGLKNLEFEMYFTSKDEFVLKSKKEKYEKTHRFFEKIETPRFAFSIIPVEERTQSGEYLETKYEFKINKLGRLVDKYQSIVFAERINPHASVVELILEDANLSKGADFLNTLCNVSVAYTLDKKNLIANNTIKFINSQLVGVSDSLSDAERVLENFRSKNEVMDVSMQGQMIIQQAQELENQRAVLLGKIDYLKYLYNYIQGDRNIMDIMSPLSMGVSDAVLSQLITELTSINAEKSSMQFNSRVDNPNLIRLDHRLKDLKNTIMENTRSAIESNNRSLEDLNNRIMKLSSEIRQLPKTEQLLVGIERRFRMNDQMYTFLLERRSEAEMAKASNMPDNEIVQEARLARQTAPSKTKMFMIIFIFGVVFPIAIAFVIAISNNKVLDLEDLSNMTKVPVLGSIPQVKTNDITDYLKEKSKTVLAESLRAIRTNLDFYNGGKSNQTILVTSSLPYEGKTFLSIGLSQSFSQLDKKVVLIDLDLRKVTTTRQLGFTSDKPGLSNLLAKDGGLKISDIVIKNHKDFDFIPGGFISPNPMELMSRPAMDEFIEKLKQIYDVIILDTPPIGLVADAQLLLQYSDVVLLAARYDHTPMPMLKQVLGGKYVAQMKNLNIVLNGIPLSDNKYSYINDYYRE